MNFNEFIYTARTNMFRVVDFLCDLNLQAFKYLFNLYWDGRKMSCGRNWKIYHMWNWIFWTAFLEFIGGTQGRIQGVLRGQNPTSTKIPNPSPKKLSSMQEKLNPTSPKKILDILLVTPNPINFLSKIEEFEILFQFCPKSSIFRLKYHKLTLIMDSFRVLKPLGVVHLWCPKITVNNELFSKKHNRNLLFKSLLSPPNVISERTFNKFIPHFHSKIKFSHKNMKNFHPSFKARKNSSVEK